MDDEKTTPYPHRDEYPEDLDQGPPLTLAQYMEAVSSIAETYGTPGQPGPVVVVDGYNVSLKVRAGCLEITDGVHPYQRKRTISRSDRTVQRVLVLGAGFITTEAMLWCHELKVPLVVARTGQVPTMVSAPVLYDHGGIRRAQAVAAYVKGKDTRSLAVTIGRYLLDTKLANQARTLTTELGRPDVGDAIHALRRGLFGTGGTEELMLVEARAADLYWQCWSVLCLRFARGDLARVPAHWQGFTGRHSPLAVGYATNRHATTPVNALLNLGYKVAETEATIACLAVGLDPSIGFAHATLPNRPAAALDIMEAVRGVVDDAVLTLVAERTFRKVDFSELRNGTVRVRPPLSHLFMQGLSPNLRDQLAPIVDHVLRMLAQHSEGSPTVPYPLSRASRTKARKPRPLRYPWSCTTCGAPVTNPRHTRCQPCQDADPRQAPTVRANRGRAIARARHRDAQLSQAGAVHPGDWPPIRTGLASVSLTAIMERCHVSKSTAWSWRAGRTTPAVGHWRALAELGRVVASEPG